MPVARYLAVSLLALFVLTCGVRASITEPSPRPPRPQPSAQQLPGDVVRIVIEALANNDEPFADAGIETTFAFASPANKAGTGPLPRFRQMVKSPTYGIMIDHVEHEFSEVVLTGSSAYQMVRIEGANGARVIFAFRLSLQRDGLFAGMWMTDAVWPVAGGDIPEQAF